MANRIASPTSYFMFIYYLSFANFKQNYLLNYERDVSNIKY
jgi:hypothetical protein